MKTPTSSCSRCRSRCCATSRSTSNCRPLKKKAIAELGYGANAKVLVGFNSRPWQKLGYTGATYSDEPFQLAWDNSFLQSPAAGG